MGNHRREKLQRVYAHAGRYIEGRAHVLRPCAMAFCLNAYLFQTVWNKACHVPCKYSCINDTCTARNQNSQSNTKYSQSPAGTACGGVFFSSVVFPDRHTSYIRMQASRLPSWSNGSTGRGPSWEIHYGKASSHLVPHRTRWRSRAAAQRIYAAMTRHLTDSSWQT